MEGQLKIKHPCAGSITGEYFESDDGSVKVPAFIMRLDVHPEIKKDIAEYKWNGSDFLLASYPKNGTHFMWEVMNMLIHGSADYIQFPKQLMFIDAYLITEGCKVIPSPRVLNTHYRTDVLGPELRKGKTVIVMRNPKDVCVSFYHHETGLMPSATPLYKDLESMSFGDYVRTIFFDKDQPYGHYFDYIEYMWTLRDDPNHLLVFYEDLKLEPVATIQKVNEFMGTNASPELVQKIADAINFDKMKKAKSECKLETQDKEEADSIRAIVAKLYRKGGIGDWKNHFTVADNEMFDEFLASWEGGKDIPFKY